MPDGQDGAPPDQQGRGRQLLNWATRPRQQWQGRQQQRDLSGLVARLDIQDRERRTHRMRVEIEEQRRQKWLNQQFPQPHTAPTRGTEGPPPQYEDALRQPAFDPSAEAPSYPQGTTGQEQFAPGTERFAAIAQQPPGGDRSRPQTPLSATGSERRPSYERPQGQFHFQGQGPGQPGQGPGPGQAGNGPGR
jgi:hypothetical protein